MSNNNQNRITTITSIPSGDIDPRYKDVPMDLNSSPLQDYFEQALLYNNNDDAAVATSSNGKTMPVLIPGSSENTNHDKKRRHHKRRRKPVAHTFPDDGLEAVMERRQQQAPVPLKQPNNQKGSQLFIVGSLQEKPPVPWPTALTKATDNSRRHRLANRQTVNWPIVGTTRYFEEDENNIFNMDNDFYNSSDFEEDDFDE